MTTPPAALPCQNIEAALALLSYTPNDLVTEAREELAALRKRVEELERVLAARTAGP